MTLIYLGTPRLKVYTTSGAEPWPAGETRVVDAAEGARLLETHPSAFERVGVVEPPKKPKKSKE